MSTNPFETHSLSHEDKENDGGGNRSTTAPPPDEEHHAILGPFNRHDPIFDHAFNDTLYRITPHDGSSRPETGKKVDLSAAIDDAVKKAVAPIQKELDDCKEQHKTEIDDIKKELDDVKKDLRGTQVELAGTQEDLAGTCTTLVGIETNLTTTQTDLAATQVELTNAMTDIEKLKRLVHGPLEARLKEMKATLRRKKNLNAAETKIIRSQIQIMEEHIFWVGSSMAPNSQDDDSQDDDSQDDDSQDDDSQDDESDNQD